MIYIKENVQNKINSWNDSSIYVVTDFDRTLTKGNCMSSWNVLDNSPFLPKEYSKETKKLFETYYPIEIDEALEEKIKNQFMVEWWTKHINLFKKYKLKEELIETTTINKETLEFRKGAKNFLENMYKRKIPVIIISAGFGNFIEQFLIKNDCNYNNIYIVSNFIKFENGIAVGTKDHIIHSLNKDTNHLPKKVKQQIRNRNHIILLGDAVADVKMVNKDQRKEALKIAFVEKDRRKNITYFKKEFDIICTNHTSFDELKEKISIINKTK